MKFDDIPTINDILSPHIKRTKDCVDLIKNNISDSLKPIQSKLKELPDLDFHAYWNEMVDKFCPEPRASKISFPMIFHENYPSFDPLKQPNTQKNGLSTIELILVVSKKFGYKNPNDSIYRRNAYDHIRGRYRKPRLAIHGIDSDQYYWMLHPTQMSNVSLIDKQRALMDLARIRAVLDKAYAEFSEPIVIEHNYEIVRAENVHYKTGHGPQLIINGKKTNLTGPKHIYLQNSLGKSIWSKTGALPGTKTKFCNRGFRPRPKHGPHIISIILPLENNIIQVQFNKNECNPGAGSDIINMINNVIINEKNSNGMEIKIINGYEEPFLLTNIHEVLKQNIIQNKIIKWLDTLKMAYKTLDAIKERHAQLLFMGDF